MNQKSFKKKSKTQSAFENLIHEKSWIEAEPWKFKGVLEPLIRELKKQAPESWKPRLYELFPKASAYYFENVITPPVIEDKVPACINPIWLKRASIQNIKDSFKLNKVDLDQFLIDMPGNTIEEKLYYKVRLLSGRNIYQPTCPICMQPCRFINQKKGFAPTCTQHS